MITWSLDLKSAPLDRRRSTTAAWPLSAANDKAVRASYQKKKLFIHTTVILFFIFLLLVGIKNVFSVLT